MRELTRVCIALLRGDERRGKMDLEKDVGNRKREREKRVKFINYKRKCEHEG